MIFMISISNSNLQPQAIVIHRVNLFAVIIKSKFYLSPLFKEGMAWLVFTLCIWVIVISISVLSSVIDTLTYTKDVCMQFNFQFNIEEIILCTIFIIIYVAGLVSQLHYSLTVSIPTWPLINWFTFYFQTISDNSAEVLYFFPKKIPELNMTTPLLDEVKQMCMDPKCLKPLNVRAMNYHNLSW